MPSRAVGLAHRGDGGHTGFLDRLETTREVFLADETSMSARTTTDAAAATCSEKLLPEGLPERKGERQDCP